jgi:hypothetical protein
MCGRGNIRNGVVFKLLDYLLSLGLFGLFRLCLLFIFESDLFRGLLWWELLLLWSLLILPILLMIEVLRVVFLIVVFIIVNFISMGDIGGLWSAVGLRCFLGFFVTGL